MPLLSPALAIFCVAPLLSAAVPPPTTPENLKPTILAHLKQERFHQAIWGIRVESLDSGRLLFQHNDHKLLKPASNAKLFTAALALDRLGPDHQLRTSFYARDLPNRSGTVSGDLWVYGRGDFSFAARFHDGDHSAALTPLVDAIRNAGIRRIRGTLVGDATYFHGPHYGSGWTWNDLQHYYGAEVSALVLEDNVVDLVIRPGPEMNRPCLIDTFPPTSYLLLSQHTLTVPTNAIRSIELYRPPGAHVIHVTGQLPLSSASWTEAVAVPDAPQWFVTQLAQQLSRQHVRIGHTPRTIDWLAPPETRPDYSRMVEVAAVDSPPLRELLHHMMKPSQNLYAQSLLLQVGRQRQSQPDPTKAFASTTEESAIDELQTFLTEIGIPANSVMLEEGTGLSRRALITPAAIVALLKFMDRHRHAAIFRRSLPVAGVDGTLRGRMNNTPAEGRVWAKTGSLAHVHTLSGYVITMAGERLVFSFMLNNNNPDSPTETRSDLDFLAILLAALAHRS